MTDTGYFTDLEKKEHKCLKKVYSFYSAFCSQLSVCSLQSAFYTQSAVYPWSAVCSLQSAVCVLEKPRSREPSQPALSYEHIENFTKDLEVRRDLGNRASPVNRAHMKRPLHWPVYNMAPRQMARGDCRSGPKFVPAKIHLVPGAQRQMYSRPILGEGGSYHWVWTWKVCNEDSLC